MTKSSASSKANSMNAAESGKVTVRVPKIRRDTVRMRLIIFGTLALILLVCSIFAEQLTPYDPYLQDLGNAKAAPSAAHLLGTDRYGRDMLSRVIAGSRTSIYSTLLLVAIITVIGTAVGVFCGWHGKWLDTVLMRISDMFLAFPGLVFALAVAAVLGGGLQNAIIALAAISWPKYARLARSQTLAHKEMPYIKAAVLSGSGTAKILAKHILPNIKAHPAEHHGTNPGHLYARHRNNDDGTGRAELPRTWRETADRRVGEHDERHQKSAHDSALGHIVPGFCDLYIGDDL